MGRYISPANPYEEFDLDCIKVYYPSSPFFFRALMGQLTYLESRFVWDTDGDIEAAEKIEQDWFVAGEQTRQGQLEGCADCGDLEQIIIDLTIQLENCQNELQEIENMEITVNCNCGCCGGGDSFPNPDGLPTIPVDPIDPLGDYVPTWDENEQTPPPGYEDWQAYIDDRCRAANWFVDSYIQLVENLDLMERKLSAGGSVAEVAYVLLKALPGPLAEWAGTAVLIKWSLTVAKTLLDWADLLEDVGDWLQLSTDSLETNKQELVCGVSQMSSVEWLQEFLLTFFAGYIEPDLEVGGASDEVVTWMRELLYPLASDLARKASDGFANQSIPEDYVPSIDCSVCAPLCFQFAPIPSFMTFQHLCYQKATTLEVLGTLPGTTNISYELTGNVLEIEADLPGGSTQEGRVHVKIGGRPAANVVGLVYLAEEVFLGHPNHAAALTCREFTDNGLSLMGTGGTAGVQGATRISITGSSGEGDELDDATWVQKWPNMVQGDFPTLNEMSLGLRSGVAGTTRFRFSNFYWVIN